MRAIAYSILAFLALSFSVAQASPEGVYSLPGGQRAIVATINPPHGGPHLLFVRTDTGAVRFMKPQDPSQWTISATLIPHGSPVATIRELPGALTIDDGKYMITAPRITFRTIPITFENSGLTLHGTVLMPLNRQRVAGVVLMHGSDDGTRDDNGMIPYLFVSYGLAVLTYDKRGSGESTPFVGPASSELLAGDGLSAAHTLSRMNGVDRNRIGAWGASQGGMLSILMAARDPLISFAIDQSGYFVPTWQADLFELQGALRAAHASDAEISEATAFENQEYAVARSGVGWAALQAAATQVKTRPWFGNVFMPDSEADLQRYWNDRAAFDPSQSGTVHAKVLGIYGTLDKSSPMPQSAINLSDLLDRSANTDSSVVILPNVNHQLLEAHTGYDDELLGLSNYSNAYLRFLTEFIESI